jgi:hypothetical protein
VIGYFSRTGTKRNLDILRARGWRILVSAMGVQRTEGFDRYALDNGAWSSYTQGRPFDDDAFRRCLRALGAGADWTVIPDEVAAGARSLEMSLRWMRHVLDETPRALLAVQDGMTVDDVRPFLGARVGIFVGGSTEWKLSTLADWCALGTELGVWCHIGRVNTVRRIKSCAVAGATSFDGTSASRFAVSIPKLDHARKQGALFA